MLVLTRYILKSGDAVWYVLGGCIGARIIGSDGRDEEKSFDIGTMSYRIRRQCLYAIGDQVERNVCLLYSSMHALLVDRLQSPEGNIQVPFSWLG